MANTMIYSVLKANGDEKAFLFFSYPEYHAATFNPEIEEICFIELGRLHGKTYREKQAAIQAKAIDYSNNQYPGLSWGELSDIQEYFERYGRRYGLISEFNAEAIC